MSEFQVIFDNLYIDSQFRVMDICYTAVYKHHLSMMYLFVNDHELSMLYVKQIIFFPVLYKIEKKHTNIQLMLPTVDVRIHTFLLAILHTSCWPYL